MAAQRVVQEQRDQEEREHAQRREQQDRLKREREINGYLGEVLPYLLERAREPRDIKLAAEEIFGLTPKIKTAIKPQLLQDLSLNWLNSKQRVRELVDNWLETSRAKRSAH